MIFNIYFTVFIRREKKSVDFILKSAKAFFFYYEYYLTVNL